MHEHVEAFAAEVAQLGITEGVGRLFKDEPVVISVDVTEVFDQTSREGAGTRLG